MTQTSSILSHLKIYGSITPIEALELFGCFRLSGRILELREAGYPIRTKYIHKNGKIFAEYWLDKEQMTTGQVSFV